MHDGFCIVVMKDERISMPTVVGHNNWLSGIVSAVEPSDIPLADVEFCPPSHGDPSPNYATSISIAVVCDHGCRLVTLPCSTSNPLPPTIKIETFEFCELPLDHFVLKLKSHD